MHCDEQLTKIVGAGGMPKFEHTYTHPQNRQTYRMYRLPKREALILVSGYSVELRAKIIERLEYLENELKNQSQYKLPQTYKTPYGSKVSLKTLVTGKGQIYFTEKLRKEIK